MNTRPVAVLVLSAILSAALAGCATGLPRKDEGKLNYVDYAGEPVEGFTAMRIQGWTPVAREKLLVWTGINEAWLVRVWDGCEDLLFANLISVTRTGSRVSRFDTVRVGNDRCPITEIRPVDIRHMKADRAAAKPPT
jgi:hypothetical protein